MSNKIFYQKIMLITLFLIFPISLHAEESQDRIKALVIGKVAKYVKWDNTANKKFIITVLNDKKFSKELKALHNIKEKSVMIKNIKSINKLTATDILYIPKEYSQHISNLLKKIENRNILTMSDMRGFAQKGGVIQLSFVSQKIKLKVNTDAAASQGLHITPTLLRIADRVKGDKS